MIDGANLSEMMRARQRQSNALHEQFLSSRRQGLQGMAALIERQIQPAVPAQAVRFTSEQLDAFGFGRYSVCFGQRFEKYDGRRIPRIPNRDLKMMSRVLDITGVPGSVRPPASVRVAYDVPAEAWYFENSAEIPLGLWLEIALQPCGFLSAYLDTYALVPLQEYFFRNLDGTGSLLARFDPRGVTLVTTAELLSSVVSGGTVIQKFAYRVFANEQPVFVGESSFGYFSPETMANQQGIDGGRQVLPWLRSIGSGAQVAEYGTSASRLRPFERVMIAPEGGLFGRGCVYASLPVDPQGWFFPFHFDGDPVMPGSLGVEAVLEMLKVYAAARGFAGVYTAAQAQQDEPVRWRYRGQITRQHKMMELEAHIRDIEQRGSQTTLRADANVWVDGLRIYEIKNAAIAWDR